MPIDLIELSGTSREMGRCHGEELRREIRDFTDLRLALTRGFLEENRNPKTKEEILAIAGSHLRFHQEYDVEGYEELLGISDGAGVSAKELIVCNGLTDFREVVFGGFFFFGSATSGAASVLAFASSGGVSG